MTRSTMHRPHTAFSFLQTLTVAVTAALWYQERADFQSFCTKGQLGLSKWPQPEARSYFSNDGSLYLDKVILNCIFPHPVLIY